MLLEDLWGGGMWQREGGPLPASHENIGTSIAKLHKKKIYQHLVSLEEDLKCEMTL